MARYYESGLPQSNCHKALDMVALGENNHITRVLVDDSNRYGAGVGIKYWWEHDDDPHWHSARDHNGAGIVAELDHPADADENMWQSVWERNLYEP